MQASSAASPKQLAANRVNSLSSTGPRTEAGKAISSRNALRTGLTGLTIMLSADEADAYELHLARFACEFNPSGERETELVQSLADAQWRMNHIPILEAGIYAMGRVAFADLFEDHPLDVRLCLIQAHTYITYERKFCNLSIQESRLRRLYAKDLAELTELQTKRQASEKAAKAKQPAAGSKNGFEFSPQHAVIPASSTALVPTALDATEQPQLRRAQSQQR